jgi:hypothetical protein
MQRSAPLHCTAFLLLRLLLRRSIAPLPDIRLPTGAAGRTNAPQRLITTLGPHFSLTLPLTLSLTLSLTLPLSVSLSTVPVH